MRGADRRQAILDAALECFLSRGVAGTTLEQVLELSGASTGSVYHHFGNKVELAATLYLETLEAYHEGFLGELARLPRARDGVEGMVRHRLRFVRDQPRLASYLTHCREPEVALASEKRAQELNARFFTAVLAWLEGHARERRLRKLSPELYFALWLGPAEELTRIWLAGERKAGTLESAMRVLAGAAWDALKGESAETGARSRKASGRRRARP
jgi:AcrR family transcriptional regulator